MTDRAKNAFFACTLFLGGLVNTQATANDIESAATTQLPATPKTQNSETSFELSRIYAEMAYRDEACLQGPCENQSAYRWQKPISIHVSLSSNASSSSAVVEDAMATFLSFARSATGGRLQFEADGSNVLIVIGAKAAKTAVRRALDATDRAYFNKLDALVDEGCFALVTTRDGQILKAIIFIPESYTGNRLRNCILEELYNSLGLFADPIGYASLFDVFEPQPDYEFFPFTPEMHRLLEMHYRQKP